MKQYDAYLFDWDGTLAQTLQVWLRTFRKHLEPYDVHPTEKEIAIKLFGNPARGVLDFGLTEGQRDEFIAGIKAVAPGVVASVDLYPDVKELLSALKEKHKKLGLITASLHDTTDIVIRRHDLLELFDVVVTGDDISEHKPNPEGFLTAAKHLGVERSRSLILGDSEKDMGAAKNAGMDSLLYFPEGNDLFYDRQELESYQPTYVITSWQELIDQVQ